MELPELICETSADALALEKTLPSWSLKTSRRNQASKAAYMPRAPVFDGRAGGAEGCGDAATLWRSCASKEAHSGDRARQHLANTRHASGTECRTSCPSKYTRICTSTTAALTPERQSGAFRRGARPLRLAFVLGAVALVSALPLLEVNGGLGLRLLEDFGAAADLLEANGFLRLIGTAADLPLLAAKGFLQLVGAAGLPLFEANGFLRLLETAAGLLGFLRLVGAAAGLLGFLRLGETAVGLLGFLGLVGAAAGLFEATGFLPRLVADPEVVAAAGLPVPEVGGLSCFADVTAPLGRRLTEADDDDDDEGGDDDVGEGGVEDAPV